MEAHGPLDDPRLVGMIEIRQTVRDAPGAEREPDGKNEEEPEPNSPVAPVLGRAASGRGVATPGHIPRWKLWFPKGSPHASPLTSVAPGQRMRASPRAASSSSSLASGGPVCEPQGRQDDVPAALDVQYATRALYNGQFRHPGRARPARCRTMRFWTATAVASGPAGIRRSVQALPDRDVVGPRLVAEHQLAEKADGEELNADEHAEHAECE